MRMSSTSDLYRQEYVNAVWKDARLSERSPPTSLVPITRGRKQSLWWQTFAHVSILNTFRVNSNIQDTRPVYMASGTSETNA